MEKYCKVSKNGIEIPVKLTESQKNYERINSTPILRWGLGLCRYDREKFKTTFIYNIIMKQFNVIIFDFNTNNVKYYDIIPYLKTCYNKTLTKPHGFDEFKEFIKQESLCQWWSRCQYEMIVTSFPPTETRKIDVHYQILANLDIITNILMEEVYESGKEMEDDKTPTT